MSESLSKKFISDEEIEGHYGSGLGSKSYGGLSPGGLAGVRACIDKALDKAGVTESAIKGHIDQAVYRIDLYPEGFPCPVKDPARAILYIQSAKPVKSAEERIAAVLAEHMHAPNDLNMCCRMAAKLRGE